MHIGCINDQPEDGLAVGGGGEPPAHDLSGCFGMQVPPSPGRPALTDHLDHPATHRRHGLARQVGGADQRLPLLEASSWAVQSAASSPMTSLALGCHPVVSSASDRRVLSGRVPSVAWARSLMIVVGDGWPPCMVR